MIITVHVHVGPKKFLFFFRVSNRYMYMYSWLTIICSCLILAWTTKCVIPLSVGFFSFLIYIHLLYINLQKTYHKKATRDKNCIQIISQKTKRLSDRNSTCIKYIQVNTTQWCSGRVKSSLDIAVYMLAAISEIRH
jgi:hypothetical protein